MNRKEYAEACRSTEPIHRNFIRENVLRLKSMQRGQKTRTKYDAKPQTKTLQTKSLLRVADRNSGLIRPKQYGRRPKSQRAQAPAPTDAAVETCERGIQTEVMGEFSQVATEVNEAARRRPSGYGDAVVGATWDGLSNAKPVTTSSGQITRQRDGMNRQNVKSTKACQQASNRRPVGENVETTPATEGSTNKANTTSKEARVGKKIKADRDNGRSECPRGHMMLPDEERERTLHLLMDSYKAKVREMNSLPVRSDTLKIQRRKMALEEELKKIDEGIKIFQRAKVFVKANA